MTRHLLTFSSFAITASLLTAPALAEGKTAWRLFVADQVAPVVRALDAKSGDVLETFKLNAPAGLSRSDSGRLVFANERDAGQFSVISSGVSIDDHGDHGDLKLEKPALLDVKFAGKKPSHFVDHHGQIALFFDGDGVVKIVKESDILSEKAETREIKVASPHHGVAVAFGDNVLVSEPHPTDPVEELPVGVRIAGADNAVTGELYNCPDLHGEAASGSIVAIACKSGLLLVKSGNDGPQIEHLDYSKSLPEGKSSTLVGGQGLQYFLGNYGPQAVVLIDPASEDAFRRIELPARRVHFAVDSARPRFAYIFTEDGQLHQLDVVTGSIEKSLKLTDPYSMDGHWNLPRPRIAVAGDDIIVSDPLKGRLQVVDAGSFEKTRDIPVEGTPYNVVAIGGSGEVHE
ncbi:zinc metallochaperone AztD [Phyllobacterium sp. SB3]|uniref:zinc metallochaperone AztD n=1 Tax=Phyllobacterium sp. SB3 TaxID=3156073 RepID=UPI0032AECCD1